VFVHAYAEFGSFDDLQYDQQHEPMMPEPLQQMELGLLAPQSYHYTGGLLIWYSSDVHNQKPDI
jgi:hypothetical protein